MVSLLGFACYLPAICLLFAICCWVCFRFLVSLVNSEILIFLTRSDWVVFDLYIEYDYALLFKFLSVSIYICITRQSLSFKKAGDKAVPQLRLDGAMMHTYIRLARCSYAKSVDTDEFVGRTYRIRMYRCKVAQSIINRYLPRDSMAMYIFLNLKKCFISTGNG